MKPVAGWMLNVGVFACVLGLSKLHAEVIAVPAYPWAFSMRFVIAVSYATLLAVAAYSAGLPDVPRTTVAAVARAVAAIGAALLTTSIAQLIVGDAILPRFVVFGSAALLLPWFVACHAVATRGRSRAEDRDRVVVVASGAIADQLAADLAIAPERPAVVVSTVTPLQVEQRSEVLLHALRESNGTVLVVSVEAQEAIAEHAAEFQRLGVRVRTLSTFCAEWLGKASLSDLDVTALLSEIDRVRSGPYGRLKRVLDLGLAVCGAIVLIAVLPFMALAYLFLNRGTLFYRQGRIGEGGRAFEILKFRTMRRDALGSLTGSPIAHDPDPTRFGSLIRGTHLDELPQVLNVFRGEMSVVGPRPEQPHRVATLTEQLPHYDLRHSVRPGITGWAQVKYGYGIDDPGAAVKHQYDLYYLANQRLGLDLCIIARTLRSIVLRETAAATAATPGPSREAPR